MALKVHLISGKSKWFKALGTPPPGYDNGPNEWSFDVVLDEKGKADFLASGADPFYIKTDKDGEEFVRFTRKEVKQDGTKAKPIAVIASDGSDWNPGIKVGNGSTLNVSFTLNEVKSKGTKRLKPSVLKVQVWDHVKFENRNEFPTKPVEVTPEAEW